MLTLMLFLAALALLIAALSAARRTRRTRRTIGPVWHEHPRGPARSTLDALREKNWSPERLRREALTAQLAFGRPDLARLYLDEAEVRELAQRLTAPSYRLSCAYAVVRG